MATNKFLEKNLNALTEELTTLTKETALTMGWDKKVVDSLTVSWDNNGIEPEYPDALETEVDSFEFGSANNTLMPALRVSENNEEAQNLVEKYIGNAFNDIMMNSEMWR